MSDPILGFFDDYRYLSNFWIAPMVVRNMQFPSMEHYYQAWKSCHPSDFEVIRNAITPGEAKRLGKNIQLRPDWELVKDRVMETGLRNKFTQNIELKHKLLSTGDSYLEETNTWNDTYWGVCKGKGKNKLGILLMSLRNELKMEDLLYDG